MVVGLWAVGLLGAGLFLTDPDSGYPPGSPVPVEEPTVHGIQHTCRLVSASPPSSRLASCLLDGSPLKEDVAGRCTRQPALW
jgi:hypothetical protein